MKHSRSLPKYQARPSQSHQNATLAGSQGPIVILPYTIRQRNTKTIPGCSKAASRRRQRRQTSDTEHKNISPYPVSPARKTGHGTHHSKAGIDLQHTICSLMSHGGIRAKPGSVRCITGPDAAIVGPNKRKKTNGGKQWIACNASSRCKAWRSRRDEKGCKFESLTSSGRCRGHMISQTTQSQALFLCMKQDPTGSRRWCRGKINNVQRTQDARSAKPKTTNRIQRRMQRF